eukprot:scaffold23476_cov125-Cylindrotheca_fusiformis.AAC.4
MSAKPDGGNGVHPTAVAKPQFSRAVSEVPKMAAGPKNVQRVPGPPKKETVSIFDDSRVIESYASVPLIELDPLPRGGISFETKAVGRIQFGIPPETIKDSMQMGIEVPRVYIVPVERFCREQGSSLGVNMAEFEFPAYFNYFVRKKRCTLVVDTPAAETEIRNVFGETLLGPAHFRDHNYPVANIDDDFDPGFPKDRRPNFYKEFANFRANEKTSDYDELGIDVLIDFCHYEISRKNDPRKKEKLGVPPETPLLAFDEGLGPASDHPNPILSPFSNGSSGRARSHSSVQAGSAGLPFTDENVSPMRSPVTEPADRVEQIPAPRRNSLVSAYSQASQATSLDSSHHSALSRGKKLLRTNSDGSLSKSSRTSGGQASRRSSLGSLEERPESFRSINRRVSWTMHAIPAHGSFSNSSNGFESPAIRGNKRRDSLFTNYSSRGSTKVSGMTSIDSYDFIMDDEPDRQETTWMYSQAKWLGKWIEGSSSWIP